jgi:hypothetical protein
MVLRRQFVSYDDWVHKPFFHQTSPRKWRANQAAQFIPNYTPSILYTRGHRGVYVPTNDAPGYWIGKKLLYWQGESLYSYVQQVRLARDARDDAISEFEIAQFTRPNIYRIIFVDEYGVWRSKPDISYRAGRLNIFVGPDDRIRGVGYF